MGFVTNSGMETIIVYRDFIEPRMLIQKTESSLSMNASLILVAKILSFVVSFLFPFIVVRVLTQSDVGVYRHVISGGH